MTARSQRTITVCKLINRNMALSHLDQVVLGKNTLDAMKRSPGMTNQEFAMELLVWRKRGFEELQDDSWIDVSFALTIFAIFCFNLFVHALFNVNLQICMNVSFIKGFNAGYCYPTESIFFIKFSNLNLNRKTFTVQ